ncbi:dTDP-4-dehydrorhamnose 3,5-epimerase family protein [Actinomycetospora termitidis]|uniref:dTDP-4-dehydrorhamnose 3,5-epimerase n=1 Tax=Actinomycetospora termitidis TaxID=3053470 RepID=A0ABT7MDP7_9PSEU|nr:dTDP-4-dehydrorhamnose 3,5-epimerase [Actinomycetospora sp. Odt1-22]MDL5158591.1 dTDP-4-dehydrorhamnose 3,5-epimerase [Actinomycetospora sp. Odt1-22]
MSALGIDTRLDTTDAPGTVRDLAVAGAWTIAPPVFGDDRGAFVSPFVEPEHLARTGRRLFAVRQASFSRSAAGVVRGIHYSTTPEGQAKYVWCSAGSVLDYVVDLRVGSPTFGVWDAVRLDAARGQAVSFPVGVGHAFVALTDGASMTYLLSTSYEPEHERAVSVHDPEIGLALPDDLPPAAMSPRDTAAPGLAELRAAGLLPDHPTCVALERRLYGEDPSS